MKSADEIRVLAVASIGGHWEQLMLMRDVFETYDGTFVTTDRTLTTAYDIKNSFIVSDCNRDTPVKMIRSFFQTLMVVAKVRPHVVISTGALPGLFCLVSGRIFGATTIWIDSVANAEELSMCGRYSKRICHHSFTQWEHLAEVSGVKYIGSVL